MNASDRFMFAFRRERFLASDRSGAGLLVLDASPSSKEKLKRFTFRLVLGVGLAVGLLALLSLADGLWIAAAIAGSFASLLFRGSASPGARFYEHALYGEFHPSAQKLLWPSTPLLQRYEDLHSISLSRDGSLTFHVRDGRTLKTRAFVGRIPPSKVHAALAAVERLQREPRQLSDADIAL